MIHCDVTPMDNSDTKMESVSWTCKNFADYAPMFAYADPYGLMLNNELRPGSAHSNCEGTPDWFDQTLKMAKTITSNRRVVFRAVERFAEPNGQFLSPCQITIDAYWTSLDWTPGQVHCFYNQRGTSEQYHSELKTDMGVECLPSGKFSANQQVLDMAMIAYNLLRMMGQNGSAVKRRGFDLSNILQICSPFA